MCLHTAGAGAKGAAAEEEGPDVAGERARVDALWQSWSANPAQPPPAAIMLHQLRKTFPSQNGGQEKVAVQVRRGEIH